MSQTEVAPLSPDDPWPFGADPFAAAAELDGKVLRTTSRRLPWLERLVGVPVSAKLEFHQHTGSFKYRGAYLAVSRGGDGPVIAASAGNHGLAVAEAARRLGRRANICVPTVASRLKRERILATGAGLIEYGASVEDAGEHARALAAKHDVQYISSYSNVDVIAGASTIGLEMLADDPDLATIIAPVGGGGLISGLGIAAATVGATPTLFGCEPERYASVTASLAADEIVRVVHQPTFADGLAVNLEQDAITYPVIARYVTDTLVLSEEELAAGTHALLVHESLLVEPAGAAAVIACLRLAQQGRLTGPVGIPLCGGNIQHGVLSRIERFPYTDDDLVRLLDLKGRRATAQPVPLTRPLDEVQALPASAIADVSTAVSEEEAVSEQAADLVSRLDSCLRDLAAGRDYVQEFARYCEENSLLLDDAVVQRVAETTDRAIAQLTRKRRALALNLDLGSDPSDALALAETRLRFGLATLAFVRGALEWCSPSYAQSQVIQFFNTRAQDSPTVNYERYENASAQSVEQQLLEVLGARPDRCGVTVTSSGMAAYAVLEAYLLRHRLGPGDVVLLAPYIYFEASEQLRALSSVRVVYAAGYGLDEMLAAVRQHRPKVVFADPVANTAQQRMVDVVGLLERLRAEVDHPVTVVIDGTMTSAALPPDSLLSDDRVEVLYYESCSKYLQLGTDATMAGLLLHPVELTPLMDRLRRNTGTILYRYQADLFPRFDRAAFQGRMLRIGANAQRIAELLHRAPGVNGLGTVFYPGLDDHPDVAVARSLPYAGGCVTYLYHEPGRNHRDLLEPLIDYMLATARRGGVHLTKGVSFGFSVARVSCAASMAEEEPPFLRLYVGDRGEQVDLLAEAMARAITR